MSLRLRLLVTYALVGLVGIAGMAVSARFFLEAGFQDFVLGRMNRTMEQTVHTLQDSLAESGRWNHDSLSIIGMHALQQGFLLRLTDPDGQELWDARTHNSGLCNQMLQSIAKNMGDRYPDWKPEYREQQFPLVLDGLEHARLTLGYWGPWFYSDAELYFLHNLNTIELVSALVCVILALATGFVMARLISRPLQSITGAAHRLRMGELDTRINLRTGARELLDLSTSINSLAQGLSEQSYLRRRLSSDISHELRTPLASLQGSLEAMIDGIWPADARRLESCREEVLRLSRLVGQLEQLERLENHSPPAGGAPVHDQGWSMVELDALVNRVCLNAQAGFAAAGTQLVWTCPPLALMTDPDALSQILVNLLSNALKYTPSGGRVELSVQPGLSIVVADSGPGIPPGDLERIFERFYRVDSSRTRSTGGAGIGLSIVRALAGRLGGTITARNRSEGGCEFILRIPCP